MERDQETDRKRRFAFRETIKGSLPEFHFGEEVEGPFLFIVYWGEYSHDVLDFNGCPPRERDGVTDCPRVGRYNIGERDVASFSETELQALHEWVTHTVASVRTQVEKLKDIVRARVAEGEKNRQAKACELCENMNSTPRRRPNGNDSPFTCTCGIRYEYNRQLRWWERKTLAQSQHEHEETLFVLRFGEPNHCG